MEKVVAAIADNDWLQALVIVITVGGFIGYLAKRIGLMTFVRNVLIGGMKSAIIARVEQVGREVKFSANDQVYFQALLTSRACDILMLFINAAIFVFLAVIFSRYFLGMELYRQVSTISNVTTAVALLSAGAFSWSLGRLRGFALRVADKRLDIARKKREGMSA